ncbi:MAG TPA: zinc-ribbon domain-containing protein, partial [Sphingomicrobium sp.]
MILTCPNCGTQYVVKDGAIPPQGRQVRCASCKHSWHQDPDETSELELGPDAEAPVAEAEAGAPEAEAPEVAAAGEQPPEAEAEGKPTPESFAEAAMIDPGTGPEAEERAYEESALQGARVEELVTHGSPASVSAAPPEPEVQPDDEFSPFAARDEVEPGRRKPLVTLLIVLIAVVALAAAFWFFAPTEWKSRIGLAQTTTPLQLSNPPQMELRQLA